MLERRPNRLEHSGFNPQPFGVHAMAKAKKAVKKLAADSPLALAHQSRKAASARVAKLTPAQRTVELAPAIVSKAVKAIRKVGVLGTARIDGEFKYALTAEQKARILSSLSYEVEQLDGRLNPGERKTKGGSEFSF